MVRALKAISKSSAAALAFFAFVVAPVHVLAHPTATGEMVVGAVSDVDNCTYRDTLTLRSGDNRKVLVIKAWALPASYAPTDLRLVPSAYRSGTRYVRKISWPDLKALMEAARAAGRPLYVGSAYRSYATQESLYNAYVKQYGQEEADRVSARPGHSQHQLGTTVDFVAAVGAAVDDSFNSTSQARWLYYNAYKYGFVLSYPEGKESTSCYVWEGWHYRFIGRNNALEHRASGLLLDIWLKQFNTL